MNKTEDKLEHIFDSAHKEYESYMADDNQYCHEQSFVWGFQEGYLQAEKDLALTWHEVANLTAIVSMLNNTDFNGNVFEEALRRFNEQRNK